MAKKKVDKIKIESINGVRFPQPIILDIYATWCGPCQQMTPILEELEKENARIQARIDSLSSLGYQIDYLDIKAMRDDTFDTYLEAAKAQYEKEQSDKIEAEKLRLAQEESDRLAKIEEQKKLDEDRKELDELRAKNAAAQKIIDDQNAKLESDRKALEAEKNAIEAEKQKIIDDKNRADELEQVRKDAAEKAKLQAIQDAKDAEKLRLDKIEKERIEAENKAAKQPDKVKILNYIADIKAIPSFSLNTDEAKELFSKIQGLIIKIEDYTNEEITKL